MVNENNDMIDENLSDNHDPEKIIFLEVKSQTIWRNSCILINDVAQKMNEYLVSAKIRCNVFAISFLVLIKLKT